MSADIVLDKLRQSEWKISLWTTTMPGAEWCIKAKKPGIGIGTFGIQGRGFTIEEAVSGLIGNIEKHVADQSKEE